MKKTRTIAPRINPQRARRERRMGHNTVSRPKIVKRGTVFRGPVETVEEFEARCGRCSAEAPGWRVEHEN